jgi:pyrimidine-nucleoside phosphorylase
MYNPVEIIIKKRNGHILTETEMRFMVEGYITGQVPEYQMSSFLMAIFFRGMEIDEIVSLTKIYVESGSQITFPNGLQTVDKHSTGGVGDKITMTLAPIVAACGAYIPMISGRGLGHTGGTLDKLESIPDFNTAMTETDFVEKVLKHKLAIIAQSAALVPADKKIYALRDVTATVESLPLICASIMSKKIAEGARNLVIDLKVGSGAFMKTLADAEKLAELLKHTGESFGQKVSVVFTCMDSPLGYAIGNSIEIRESIEYLAGADIPDIDIITRTLAIEMLLLSGIAINESDAISQINTVLQNGSALSKFAELIKISGGNAEVCIDTNLLPFTNHKIPIISGKTGYICSIDSQKIGYALIKIGAGRTSLESPLDMGAGAYLYKKVGDKISISEEIGNVHTADIELGKSVVNEILSAISISEYEVQKSDTIIKIWR